MVNKSDIEAHPPPPRRLRALWLALYPLAWVVLFAGSSLYWFLPAGLRLGVLWILPRRSWWQMAVVEWATILAISLTRHSFESLSGLVFSTVLPWCLYALVLRGIGRHGRNTRSREALPRLLVAGLMAAIFTTMALTAIDLNDDGVLAAGLPTMLISYALGDFAGIIIIVPFLLAVRDQFGPDRVPWNALFANGLVLAPLLVVLLGLYSLPAIEALVYPMVLALFPLFGIAYRFGWRPGAIAFAVLGVGVHTFSFSIAAMWGPGQMQLLFAVSGCAMVLLGVASETQRTQRDALSATVAALSLRRNQMTEVAERMALLQQQERRRIGVELHDQLGQDMTAIATRLRVVERTASEDSVKTGLASIGRLVDDAHAHLREAINDLHPAVIDRFGLARALCEGPMAEMVRDRGMEYVPVIEGDVDRLNETIAMSLYRICQEAANNAVRHVGSGRFRIAISLLDGPHDAVVSLSIDDDGGGVPLYKSREGRGLKSIADRAEALGAAYQFNLESGKPRHSLLLRLPPLSWSPVAAETPPTAER